MPFPSKFLLDYIFKRLCPFYYLSRLLIRSVLNSKVRNLILLHCGFFPIFDNASCFDQVESVFVHVFTLVPAVETFSACVLLWLASTNDEMANI